MTIILSAMAVLLLACIIGNVILFMQVIAVKTAFQVKIQAITEKLKNDYWTKEVIKRSLMRGPHEPSNSTYEEWVVRDEQEKAIQARDIRSLNDMMYRHNCGDKDIVTCDDPELLQFGYCCQCGVEWRLSLAHMKLSLGSLPEEQREQIHKLMSSSAGREMAGKLLSTKRLKTPEQLNPVHAPMPISNPKEDEGELDVSFAWHGEEK